MFSSSSSLCRNAALLLALTASPWFVESTCINTSGACGAGCWNQGSLITSSGLRVCSPVGPGYYSPFNSNQRFVCRAGTASDDQEAAACTTCDPGSYSSSGATTCTLCPPGFYQENPGTSFCFFCDLGLYDGAGSTGVTDDGLCFLEAPSESPSSTPTTQPSVEPSFAPSAAPSTAPSMIPTSTRSAFPSQEPSVGPSAAPSLAPSHAPTSEPSAAPSSFPSLTPSSEPSNFPSELSSLITKVDPALNFEDGVCSNDEFVLHGQCSQCPSVLRSAVLAGFLAACIIVLAAYFLLTAPFGTAVLFIGVEFFQLLSLVGITHVQWPKLMDIVFAFAAIIGLDIDIIAPIQCHFGLSPQVNHFIVMLLPLLLGAISIGCVSLWHVIRKKRTEQDLSANFNSIARLLMLGLVFGYMKLVVTSVEAILCSPVQGENDQEGIVHPQIDWFCLDQGGDGDKLVAFFGLTAFFVYGIGLPVALYIMLRRYRDQVRSETEDTVTSVVLEVARVFLLTYCEDSWWWTVFVLVRKLVFVLVVTLFPDLPVLSLGFIVIVVIASSSMQWKESPYYEDTADDAEGVGTHVVRSFSMLRHRTVDLILHGSLIAIAILGGLLFFVSTTSDGRVGLGLFGLVVMIGSVILLIAAAFRACKTRFSSETTSEKATEETVSDLESRIVEDDLVL